MLLTDDENYTQREIQWTPSGPANESTEQPQPLPSGPGVGSLQPCIPTPLRDQPFNPCTGKHGANQ
jgi:hypothetical protein